MIELAPLRLPAVPQFTDYESALRVAGRARAWGTVSAVIGNQIRVRGLAAPLGADCWLLPSHGERRIARVIGFDGGELVLAPLAPLPGLAAGDIAHLLRPSALVHVGPGLCGRILDALGQPLYGRPLPLGLVPTPVDQPAPNSLDRPPITSPLATGIKAIDGLLTCGRGQRLGIFAGSGVGKSSLLAMLARGSQADINVIALVGERGREVNEFIVQALGTAGLERSVLVVATSDAPAPLRVQAATTATAIAEWFRASGRQVLLIVDSITRLAHAQRELGLAAGEPPTTRGYPPSVFSLLPRLIERTGQTREGAITAFYSVLVDGDDHDEPISDALRGLLDGHIVLSRRIAAEGRYPAIDCLASLSRLHHGIAPTAMRDAAARIRRHLAELQRHEDLIAVGAYRAGSNPALDQAIAARAAIEQFLAQPLQQVVPFSQVQQQMTAIP